jgi:ubiquinone/menaquinone biosynthesis C-methylase UbiE
MAHHDIDRFNQWAQTYERHPMQRFIFGPVQETALQLAAHEVARPTAILDVGCGTGRLLRSAAMRFPGAELVGVDAAIEMVKQAEASFPSGVAIRFQQATAEELPLQAAVFDLVFSTLTFHHWHDQRKGIAEVARVLAPGGRWLLADFVPMGMMRYVSRLLRLKRFQDRGRLEGMLSDAGLAVVAERRVPRLGGQVPVLAIGAKT